MFQSLKLVSPGSKRMVEKSQLEHLKGFADVKFKRSKVTRSRRRQVVHNWKTCSSYLGQKNDNLFVYTIKNIFYFIF